jgi:eukaryotic-like serine/threonine-protein kinase
MAGSINDPEGVSGGGDRARVYQLFAKALDYEAEARERFLSRECGADLKLRAEVDALLLIAISDTTATVTLLASPGRSSEDLTGQVYGHFRLKMRIGEGGMGVVYRAERTDGVQQSVAIKLISTTVGRVGQARFEREAQLLAQIEHPAVARLVDAGVENGRAWIAMEFVSGLRIDDYCRVKELSARDIIGLMGQLAGAVAAAHRMLVVHNDIKPANVLVTAEGVPKLIDFGISRALQEGGAVGPGGPATVAVGRLFSPGFAAPEQINGGPVTVATDVFGLGALAYRLLTGRSTFPDAVEPLDYMLAITQRDVELPSRAVHKAGRAVDARSLRGDLDAILCKALERQPERRYSTAAEFQADLQRHLDGLPVSAHASTIRYRLTKFVRRRALAVSFATLFAMIMIVGAVVYGLKERAVLRAQNFAAQRGAFLESLLKSADPSSGQQPSTVAALLDSAAESVDQRFADEPLVEASMLNTIARTNAGLGRFDAGLAANDRQIALLRDHRGSPQTLGEALSLRGMIMGNLGKWQESESTSREAVALLKPARAAASYCDALDNLATALIYLSRESEADPVLREEIAIESRGGAALQHQLMIADITYSILLGNDLGRYAEAADYAVQAWDIAQKTLPADHADRVWAEQTYGIALVNTHRAAEAEPIIRDVIARGIRTVGASHHDTLVGQLALAEDLIELGRNAEAADVALAAAKLLESQFGLENNFALLALNEYGVAACQSHQESAGLIAVQRVAAARERLLPSTNRWNYIAQTGVGLCLTRLQRYTEAEPTLLAAARGLEAARGPHFHWAQVAFKALRDLYAATNRPTDAGIWASKLTD